MPTPEETGKEPSTYDDDDQACEPYDEARGVTADREAEGDDLDEAEIVDIDLDDLVAMEGPDA